MGKGDKKSKKGKIALGSYGNSRKRGTIKAKLKRAAARRLTVEPASEGTPAKTRRVARKKSEA